MKNYLPYILVVLVLGAASILVFTGKNEKRRVLDERLSLRKGDKIPYGTFVAYENLKELFPEASISSSRKEPGYWDSLSMYDHRQALIIVSPQFLATEYELNKLVSFAGAGNDVFISTSLISEEANEFFRCGVNQFEIYAMLLMHLPQPDTLKVSLSNPPFNRSFSYEYPGKRYTSHFNSYDTSITTVLGMGEEGSPNFIHLRTGSGNIYLHLAPMTFTNYFLLRDKNIRYYEDMLSVIPSSTRRILWDEYFLLKKSNSPNDKKGWFRAFMEHEALRWAMLTALATLLIYALMEMRRKQRIIPRMPKPRNDSLDFVKTIGRLYYDKGDHKNLCRKMASYFLEHVRNRYKLSTSTLNDEFAQQVKYKSGVEGEEVANIVRFIRELDMVDRVSNAQLAYFHKQLESFYSKI